MDPLRSPANGAPSKRTFEAGPNGRRQLGRCLGLDGAGDRFAVTRARWLAGRCEVTVQAAGGEAVELVLEATADEARRRPFLSSGRIDLWYRGRLPDGLEELLRAAAARWLETPLEQLLAPVLADPRPVVPPRRPPDEGRRPRAGNTAAGTDPAAGPSRPDGREGRGERGTVAPGTWNPADEFADFLGRDTMDVMPYEAIEAGNPLVRISHSDLECLSFMPREGPSNLNLVDFPWIARREPTAPAVKQRELVLCTDLTEQSVIMGCNARVRQVLDAVLALGSARPIVFSNTCLPATTGEDAVSVLRLYRRRVPVSVVSHNRAAPDLDDDLPTALLHRRRKARAGRRQPDLVNLIGFPHDRALDELTRLLAELGLRVNAAVLPVVRPADVDRLPRASLNVFHRTNRFWVDAFHRLAAELALPSLHAPSPCGVAGTRDWLEAVAGATGRQARAKSAWQRRFAPLRAAWRRSTREARGLSVGVVVRPSDLECLEDPGLTDGVPLLATLAELGFGLAVWVHAPDDALPPLRTRLEALLPPPRRARCRVVGFESFDELRRALRESPVAAVVSNHTFDWRLTEAGKNRISLGHFEKGPEGALRTADRLLGICQNGFARRYARFLARDDLGRRRMPPAEE